MSKGKIVDTGPVDLASGTLPLPVTSAMAPKAKVIVMYIRPDGEIVADGLSFNVDGVYKNKVGIIYFHIRQWFDFSILNVKPEDLPL